MTWGQRRDEAAIKSVERYNHKDSWVQYEMRKVGQLSYVEGWNACMEDVKPLLDLMPKIEERLGEK